MELWAICYYCGWYRQYAFQYVCIHIYVFKWSKVRISDPFPRRGVHQIPYSVLLSALPQTAYCLVLVRRSHFSYFVTGCFCLLSSISALFLTLLPNLCDLFSVRHPILCNAGAFCSIAKVFVRYLLQWHIRTKKLTCCGVAWNRSPKTLCLCGFLSCPSYSEFLGSL